MLLRGGGRRSADQRVDDRRDVHRTDGSARDQLAVDAERACRVPLSPTLLPRGKPIRTTRTNFRARALESLRPKHAIGCAAQPVPGGFLFTLFRSTRVTHTAGAKRIKSNYNRKMH